VTDIEAEENENESSSKRKAGNVSVNGTSSRKKNGKGSTGNSKKSSDEDGNYPMLYLFVANCHVDSTSIPICRINLR